MGTSNTRGIQTSLISCTPEIIHPARCVLVSIEITKSDTLILSHSDLIENTFRPTLGFRATPHASPVSGQQDGAFPQETLRRRNFLGNASRFIDSVACLMRFLSTQSFVFRFHDAVFALKNETPHWHLVYHIDTTFNEGVFYPFKLKTICVLNRWNVGSKKSDLTTYQNEKHQQCHLTE